MQTLKKTCLTAAFTQQLSGILVDTAKTMSDQANMDGCTDTHILGLIETYLPRLEAAVDIAKGIRESARIGAEMQRIGGAR